MRRLSPTIALFGAGILLLWWGLAVLEGIVIEERRETKARLDETRQTLSEYARRAMQGDLADSLHDIEPEVAEAANNPLASAESLLLFDDRTQVLAHRARWVLRSDNDIPATLALLDDLYEYATPRESLAAKLLRDGLGDPPALRRAGLQPHLLARRGQFTEPDFRFLADRVIALSEQAGVPYADFEARVSAPAADRDARTVSRAETGEIELTLTEFDLLLLFADHPGKALPRERILGRVWGDVAVDPRTVDNFVSSLKRKLSWTDGCGWAIRAVRGVGYRFDRE